MSARMLLIIHGVIYALFAIVLFFIPDTLWPMYGVQVNDQYSYFLSQHNSIFLGGIAVISLLLYDIESNSKVAARKLVIGLFWTNIIGVIITLYACIKGVFVGFGWSDPAFFTLMAGFCIWHLIKSR